MTNYECLQVFPHTSNSQGLKMNSAETERIDTNQSQAEFQESPWIFKRDEMFSIGIEEVSNTSWALESSDTILLTEPLPQVRNLNLPEHCYCLIIMYFQGARLATYHGVKQGEVRNQSVNWLNFSLPFADSHMEWLSLQVFDILPLYGVLRPHSSHQISFTFYGHCDIIAQAKALCEVDGGPTYEIILRGEASLVNYSFDTKDINCGLQVLPAIGRRFSGFALNIGHSLCALISPGTPVSIVSPSPLSLTPKLLPKPDHPPTANHLPDIFTCFSHCLLKFCMLDTKICIFILSPKAHSTLFVSFNRTTPFSVPWVYELQGIFHCILPFSSPHPYRPGVC